MINEIYLAVVYRPTSGAATGLVSKILTGRNATDRSGPLPTPDAREKLAQTLAASLARYEPELLGIYRLGKVWCSSLLEYLAMLVNGEWQRLPLPTGPVNQALATTRLFFGTEAIEYRTATMTRGRDAGNQGVSHPSAVGMFNRLPVCCLICPYAVLHVSDKDNGPVAASTSI